MKARQCSLCRQCDGTTNNLFKTTTTGIYATTFLRGQQFTEVRGYIMSELLYQSKQRTDSLDTYTRASRISNKGLAGNVFEA